MVIASHVVFCTYGFWLPNDPRGSWSDFVASWELFRFGGATKTDSRRSVANVDHDWRKRAAAKETLKFPPVHLSEEQVAAVARGFAHAANESGYRIYACSILPEHVHVVVARHRHKAEQIAIHLKCRATHHLKEEDLWQDDRQVWARKCWKVFLNHGHEVRRAIPYVEDNPLKEGSPRQEWPFVIPFEAHLV